LGRYPFKDVFPVKFREKDGEEVSIFSNKIEGDKYLSGGAIFKFLKCVNRVILKEKGFVLSDPQLDQVSRDVLTMTINKELPREEEKLVRHLPGMIDLAKYRASINQPDQY